MSLHKPKNENYAARVVEITNTILLDNCDNVQHTSIFGDLVIVSKSVSVGDVGIFFPVECQLSEGFVEKNNLYRDKTLNADTEKSGYIEANRRVKTAKFRGHQSMGLFMPMDCLSGFLGGMPVEDLRVGDVFDEFNGMEVCRKYVKYVQKGGRSGQGSKQTKSESITVEGQFRFHIDTPKLGVNLHRFQPDSLIEISYKLHGTSAVFSNVLVKRKLSIVDKIADFFGANIDKYEYGNLYSSRRVLKNDKRIDDGYYRTDLWHVVNSKLSSLIPEGYSLYGEIVGYTPEGKAIQKGYDYGCNYGEHAFYLYRVTYTTPTGRVIELSSRQVRNFARGIGIQVVPLIYYGFAGDYFDMFAEDPEKFSEVFLNVLKDRYLEGPCHMCNSKVPAEGVVVRLEDTNDIEVFKLKSFAFLKQETEMLDQGEGDTEEEN